MPILSTEDWASLGADLADLYDGYGTIWRTPSQGGTILSGSPAAVGTALMSLWATPINGRLVQPDAGLGGGRVVWQCSVYYTADVRAGDEIRYAGGRYKVEGAAGISGQRPATMCELSEMRN